MSIFAIRNTRAPVYKCHFLDFCDSLRNNVDFGQVVARGFTGVRARVRMLEDHKGRGAKKGEVTITSEVRSIDIELGTIVTQNSIYVFGRHHIDPKREV